jgi:predicted cation transporter
VVVEVEGNAEELLLFLEMENVTLGTLFTIFLGLWTIGASEALLHSSLVADGEIVDSGDELKAFLCSTLSEIGLVVIDVMVGGSGLAASVYENIVSAITLNGLGGVDGRGVNNASALCSTVTLMADGSP